MSKRKRPQKPKSPMTPERVRAIQERRRSNASGLHKPTVTNWKKEWNL